MLIREVPVRDPQYMRDVAKAVALAIFSLVTTLALLGALSLQLT